MEKKFYVVIFQNEIYEFTDWPTCKSFVEGKQNVKYKGFTDKMEAKKFIDNNVKQPISFTLNDVLYAYIDGSRLIQKNGEIIYSYGLCAVLNGQIVHESCGMACDKEVAKMYQIGGELTGALKGVEFALSRGEKRVIIVYDYFGVEMWANGSWNVDKQNDFVKAYVSKMNELKKKINIDFVHVNSHIKAADKKIENIYNDRADILAKQAYKHLKELD